eukprot:scaffold3761_cov372-Prasinococcus_capsulatus_cf.AAC.2
MMRPTSSSCSARLKWATNIGQSCPSSPLTCCSRLIFSTLHLLRTVPHSSRRRPASAETGWPPAVSSRRASSAWAISLSSSSSCSDTRARSGTTLSVSSTEGGGQGKGMRPPTSAARAPAGGPARRSATRCASPPWPPVRETRCCPPRLSARGTSLHAHTPRVRT